MLHSYVEATFYEECRNFIIYSNKQEKRFRIKFHLDKGRTITEIAALLGRHRSSIYRKIKSNSFHKNYYPDTAHQIKYISRRDRKKQNKIRSNSKLYLIYYKENSNLQISGRMKAKNKEFYTCCETIYKHT